MSASIHLAQTAQEIEACFPVMSQLRTHLVQADFVALVQGMMAQGYQLAYVKQDEAIVAAAGFRIAMSLYMGKHLYVDDLITDEHTRSGGHGHALMTWLAELAKAQDCAYIHLDSGVQRHRAHRFYLNQGMDIVCYHFSKAL